MHLFFFLQARIALKKTQEENKRSTSSRFVFQNVHGRLLQTTLQTPSFRSSLRLGVNIALSLSLSLSLSLCILM
jgi:hypothetical protein